MKRLVVDLDNTICSTENSDYKSSTPAVGVIDKLKEYKRNGFEVVIYTSRNMRTYEGNVGKINAITLPIIIDWLDKNDVPYDEVIVGKPWCGDHGFYVDDRAIRPSELRELSFEEICELIENEQCTL